GCGEGAEERDAQERRRQCAALDCCDVVAVHDEDVVGDRTRDGEDQDGGASPECDEAADEEPGDRGLEHGGGPFLMCALSVDAGFVRVGMSTWIYTVSWRPASGRFLLDPRGSVICAPSVSRWIAWSG